MRGRERWGVLLLAVRPAYVVVELAVAAGAPGYSLRDDSVSALGTSASPGHVAMNAAFVVAGLLLVAGAVLLRGRLGATATVLLVVAGASSVATGLTPLDHDPGLHALAATPLFVAQPLALLVLARRWRISRPGLAAALLATGVIVTCAAVGFLLTGSGLAERIALWPVLAVAAVAAATGGAHELPGAEGTGGVSSRPQSP